MNEYVNPASGTENTLQEPEKESDATHKSSSSVPSWRSDLLEEESYIPNEYSMPSYSAGNDPNRSYPSALVWATENPNSAPYVPQGIDNPSYAGARNDPGKPYPSAPMWTTTNPNQVPPYVQQGMNNPAYTAAATDPYKSYATPPPAYRITSPSQPATLPYHAVASPSVTLSPNPRSTSCCDGNRRNISLAIIIIALFVIVPLALIRVFININASDNSNSSPYYPPYVVTTRKPPGRVVFNTSAYCDDSRRFQCRTRASGCIPIAWKCDGRNDCGDNSDEEGCACNPQTSIPCITSELGCVLKSKVCDGRNDCPYSSIIEGYYDEWLCPSYQSSYYCYFGFKCSDGKRCMPVQGRCDGAEQCFDGSDEVGCSCSKLQTQCYDGSCVEISRWCDGLKDCRDGSDEQEGCQQSCPGTSVRCATGGKCVNRAVQCDRINDCLDGSDERNCGSCASNEFQCNDKRCIDKDFLCDGTKDCSAGEDETQSACQKCSGANQFQCHHGSTSCVPISQRCDGAQQCQDGSDEAQCLYNGADGASQPGDETIALEVIYMGKNYYTCSDDWSKSWSDLACQRMGYKDSAKTSSSLLIPAISTSLININTNNPSATNLFKQPTDDTQSTCLSNKVIGVQCNPLECGMRAILSSEAGPYIINGDEAVRGAWPWQIYMETKSSEGTSACGGTIINDRWVLTAAHCVPYPTYERDVTVWAGSIHIKSGDPELQKLQVSRVIVHPLYAQSAARNVIINDLALLKLSRSVTFTDTLRPVCLADWNVDYNKFKVCVATGFGHVRSGASVYDLPKTLRQGRMAIMNESECRNSYSRLTGEVWRAVASDFEKFVCAGDYPPQGGIDICQGDSGGPIVCQDFQNVWTQVGISSFVFKDCDLSVFTRVSNYKQWINDQISRY